MHLYKSLFASAAIFATAILLCGASSPSQSVSAPAGPPSVTQGSLHVVDDEGQVAGLCPLSHTDVRVEISGFLARVDVTQRFANPGNEKIEAVYTFPLPQDAAVDDMILTVGERTVFGRIKLREEARAIYEAARAAGHVAGLLDQERPNIFTQTVANIMPNAQVEVKISYVQILRYQEGSYEFVFPMVVGPRYIPGDPAGKSGGGWASDTDQVPDASRITPPVELDRLTGIPTRAGHDIAIDISIDAGVPIEKISSKLHAVTLNRPDGRSATVRLKRKREIPNRDFILKYRVAGQELRDALLTHRDGDDGFFALILQPPRRVSIEDVTPKELVFVLDTSGSMRGFPIEKAKETMKLALEGLYPRDTFNLITFAGDTRILFPEPVPATEMNLGKAREFLNSRSGGGGTEMMKAIRAALDPSHRRDHLRIVCFMTDGFVGNDMEILAEVRKHPNARVFSFGIGNSVNRFLLEGMAKYGRGEVEYVTLSDDGSAAAHRLHNRIRNPLLTDISIDWGGLPIEAVYPERVQDLFAATKPIVMCGRYQGPASGTIRLSGRMSGHHYEREIHLRLPEIESRNSVLRTLWARERIDDLMGQDYAGIQRGKPQVGIRDEITRLGLEYRLMTQFTSFVAVEEMTFTDGGEPRRIEIPVEIPDGVDPGGIFGQTRSNKKQGMVGGISGGRNSFLPASSPRMMTSGMGEADRVSNPPVLPGSEEDIRRRLHAKLHPSLLVIVEKLKRGENVDDTHPLLRAGMVEIQIWLGGGSEDVLKELRRLGLQVLIKTGGTSSIIGKLPVRKLADLAKLEGIRYVAPLTLGRN